MYSRLGVLIYFANNFYPQIFFNILCRNYKVRFAIQILGSFADYIKLCEGLLDGFDIPERLLADIASLKAGWFNRTRAQNIKHLEDALHQAHRCAVVLLTELNSFMKRYYVCMANTLFVGAYKQGLLFIGEGYYRWPVYHELITEYAATHGRCFNLLPGSFILPLVVASKLAGTFSDRVRENLYCDSVNIQVHDSRVIDAFSKQARVFNKVLGHYQKNRIAVPPLHDYYQMFYSPIYQRYYDSNYYARIRAI